MRIAFPSVAVRSLHASPCSALTQESRHKQSLCHASCQTRVRAGSRPCAPSESVCRPRPFSEGATKTDRPQTKRNSNMRTLHCSQMKSSIERILRSHALPEKFQQSPDFAVRVTNAPHLPLTIERHGSQITVTHFVSENGDLIPDPDMEFERIDDGSWYPVAIQFATGTYRRAMEVRDGKRFVNPREVHDQIQFSRMRARYLLAQGFASGEIEQID